MKISGCVLLLCCLGVFGQDLIWAPTVSTGACGGVAERHTELHGVIRSPGPRDWCEEVNCTWIIEASSREMVTISFEGFNLACFLGLLTIWTPGKPPIRLCGGAPSRPLTFTGGKVYVHLRTGCTSYSGFNLSFVKGSLCQIGWILCRNGDCSPPSQPCSPSSARPPSPRPCRTRTLSGFYGSFSSPDYGARAGSRRPAYDCRWRIETGDRRPLLLSFPGLALGEGDRLEVWEGGEPGTRPLAELSVQDNTEWEVGGSVRSVGTATGSASVRYVSSGGRGRAGFNATYQVRGFCPPWQHPCLDGGTPACYSARQRCDGVWHCEGGRDEDSCGGCPAGHYPCGGRSRACYSPAERCDYQTNCPGGTDERGCRHCQPGTFHCADDRCIFETWACDGQPDCADGSDERDCEHPLPRKVVTAAVVGSLVCALLLVVAVGCTCKLYSLRTSHYSLFTPLAHMEAVQRRAPPSYGELIAQGAIPPVEDFPTENPNDMSVIGNIRSILQLLRQESPHQTARRRRRNRYIRRLARRFRRTRLYALLSRSTPRAGPAPATIPEPAATSAPEPTATDHPSSFAGAVPLPRKFPLLEGCPPPAAPDLRGQQPAETAASVFWGLSRRSRGAEGDGPPDNGRDMLLLPLTEASGPRESADSDEEALLC